MKTAQQRSQRRLHQLKRQPIMRVTTSREHSDLRGELYRVFGVDLTNVPASVRSLLKTILREIGTDVSRFRNASAFASG